MARAIESRLARLERRAAAQGEFTPGPGVSGLLAALGDQAKTFEGAEPRRPQGSVGRLLANVISERATDDCGAAHLNNLPTKGSTHGSH
ncbi:hypothetical protein [Phenylobacterium sp.]|uniref:hypothetical protein n=1 Tax=Phenylobacterium sp. TaxID=1871053 RepID=UPI0035B16C69